MTKIEALRECKDQSINGLFKFILNNIDGYGVEYGIDDDRDAEDLKDWLIALMQYGEEPKRRGDKWLRAE